MDSRRRNRLATIKAPPAAQDDLGQPTGAWTSVCTMWVNVLSLSGSETIRAGAESSAVKVSIRGSYRADLTSAMQVYIGSTVYQIKAVMPDEVGKNYTDLACEVVQ